MTGKILIVGGGPAGACLAWMMARAGVETVLVERHGDFSREFRGERILGAGISALEAMGLWSRIKHVETLWLDKSEMYIDRKLRMRSQATEGNRGALYLPQPPFLQAVIDAAATLPAFTFLSRTAAMGLVSEGGRVVGVEVKQEGGKTSQVRADLVICAEGRYSRLRNLAGLDDRLPGEVEENDVVWVRMPAPDFMRKTGTSQSYIGRGTLAFAFNAPGGDMSMGWAVKKGALAEMNTVAENEWFERLLAELPEPMQVHMRSHKAQMKHSLLNVLCYCVSRWWRPGLLMIGDAAHPMSPAGGQGITSAFRDAIVATNRLAPLLLAKASPQEIDAACAAFQEARVAEIVPIQAQQRRMSRLMLQRTWLGGLLMRRLMPALAKMGPRIMGRLAVGNRQMREGTPLELDPALRGAG